MSMTREELLSDAKHIVANVEPWSNDMTTLISVAYGILCVLLAKELREAEAAEAEAYRADLRGDGRLR